MTIKIYPRCILNTPALQIEWFSKAEKYGVEAGTIDLEDSVPKNKKEEARENARIYFSSKYSFINVIRINSIRSSDGIKDILLLLSTSYPPDIVILSKVESAEEIKIVSNILETINFQPQIFSAIETPKGLLNINAIAEVSNGIIFGAADYSAEMGVEITRESSMFARHMIVTTATAFGIPAIDAPCLNIDNTEELIADCEYARKIGFHGKIAIHTSQIKIINQIFSPTQEQIAWATEVIDEFTKSEKSILTLNGVTMGPPFIKMAQRILARSHSIQRVK